MEAMKNLENFPNLELREPGFFQGWCAHDYQRRERALGCFTGYTFRQSGLAAV
jgi:hypothetical protein